MKLLTVSLVCVLSVVLVVRIEMDWNLKKSSCFFFFFFKFRNYVVEKNRAKNEFRFALPAKFHVMFSS